MKAKKILLNIQREDLKEMRKNCKKKAKLQGGGLEALANMSAENISCFGRLPSVVYEIFVTASC